MLELATTEFTIFEYSRLTSFLGLPRARFEAGAEFAERFLFFAEIAFVMITTREPLLATVLPFRSTLAPFPFRSALAPFFAPFVGLVAEFFSIEFMFEFFTFTTFRGAEGRKTFEAAFDALFLFAFFGAPRFG